MASIIMDNSIKVNSDLAWLISIFVNIVNIITTIIIIA